MNNHEEIGRPELRRVQREIASVIVISKDGRFLFARKHPGKGGSFQDAWHIIGGGRDKGESLVQTAVREAREEAYLEFQEEQLTPVGDVGYGEAEKLQDGERVIAEMTYNRFEVRLPHNAADITLPTSTEEFAEFRWVEGKDIPGLQQPPGTSVFWYENGYIPTEQPRARDGVGILRQR